MKSDKKTSKWYLSLATSDYGGGCDEGVIYDSLDEVLKNGAYYIQNEASAWYEGESEDDPDEVDDQGFRNLLKQNFIEIIKNLVDDAKNDPTTVHIHSFGPMIECIDDVYIVLREATEFDVECFGE